MQDASFLAPPARCSGGLLVAFLQRTLDERSGEIQKPDVGSAGIERVEHGFPFGPNVGELSLIVQKCHGRTQVVKKFPSFRLLLSGRFHHQNVSGVPLDRRFQGAAVSETSVDEIHGVAGFGDSLYSSRREQRIDGGRAQHGVKQNFRVLLQRYPPISESGRRLSAG